MYYQNHQSHLPILVLKEIPLAVTDTDDEKIKDTKDDDDNVEESENVKE